jgi:hypothetical protein
MKRHLVTDQKDIPLSELATAANVHGTTMLERLLDAIAPVRGKRGRPRQPPKSCMPKWHIVPEEPAGAAQAQDQEPHRPAWH